MTPAEFLNAVWPDNGFYCLATIFKTPEGKSTYVHKVFDNIEGAAKFAARHSKEDIYFCVHSLKQEKVWDPKKRNYKTGEMGAYTVRTQSNMQEASSFFFDLDVGAGDHKYPTRRDALLDLKRFLVETELPYPMVTSSGGGLHVYWLIDTSLLSAEWATTAARLKALAQHHGLKADPARTTDTASVLRVAGTYNMKDKSNPRLVEVLKSAKPAPLDDFLKAVNDAVIRAGITPETVRGKKAPAAEVDDYFGASNMAPVEYDGPPTKFLDVLKNCRMMVDLTRRSEHLTQTEWFRGLGVVAFCEGDRMTAHKWSSKYPGYSPAETDAKVDQVLQFAPTKCETLQRECGADKCNGCPMRGKVPNPLEATRRRAARELAPIVVGPEEAPVALAICPPPKPYRILKSGEIVIVTKDSEGEEQTSVIYDRPVYPMRRIRNDSQQKDQLLWRVEHKHDGVKDFVIAGADLADSRKFPGQMADLGSIYVDPDNLGLMRQYMVAYIRELQRATRADAQQNYLGWNKDHTEFTLHDKIICESGEVRPAQLSSNALEAAKGIGKEGTLQRQIELMEFWNRPEYIPNQVMILQGLASVAFYATGFHGIIVNATGEPGASKSTAIYTAASFWAAPESYTVNGTVDGITNRARAALVGTLASLPVCVDEITKMDPADAANMAFVISQPDGFKRGMKPDGTFRTSHGVAADGGHKSTLMLTTANSSLQGLLAQDGQGNTAGAVRVIEMYFANPRIHEKWDAEEYLRELKQNYGHIGEAFVKVWLKDRPRHEQMVRDMMRECDILGRIQSAERFWSADFAALLTTGYLAKAAGLIPFDIDAIKKWLLEVQLVKMRGVLTQEFAGPVGLLTDYLAQITGDMIVTDKMNNGIDVLRAPRGPMMAHYDVDKKTMWVLRAAFRDYCQRRKVNYLAIIDDLAEPRTTPTGVSRIVPHRNLRKTLGAGTDYANGQAWVFEIDMTHPEISGLMPVVTTEKPALSPERAKLKVVQD